MRTNDDLARELAATLKVVEATKISRTGWIVSLVVVAFIGGAWFGGHRYAEGYEAGLLSTNEGRATAEILLFDARKRMTCDANGRNCVNN